MIITNPGLDDAELVRLISLKSRVGAEVLYDRYAKFLLLVIFHIIPQKKITEDIIEETFLLAWSFIDDFSLKKKSFLTGQSGLPGIWLKTQRRLKLFRSIPQAKTLIKVKAD